jgi:toxin YoeB
MKPETIKQCWDDQAIEGRLKLARLWDQRIINLIKAIKDNDDRFGAPEMLKGNYAGWMSRRISQKHRLVYRMEITADGKPMIRVKECGGHYQQG